MKQTYLQEAKQVGGLGLVSADHARLSNQCGKCGTLAQSTVLDGGREERRRANFLPEIIRRLIPVRSHIVQVELNDGPQRVGNIGGVPAIVKPYTCHFSHRTMVLERTRRQRTSGVFHDGGPNIIRVRN